MILINLENKNKVVFIKKYSIKLILFIFKTKIGTEKANCIKWEYNSFALKYLTTKTKIVDIIH